MGLTKKSGFSSSAQVHLWFDTCRVNTYRSVLAVTSDERAINDTTFSVTRYTDLRMTGKLIKLNDNQTTKLGVCTGELEPRQKVTKYTWNRFELSASQSAAVDWTRWLTIQPITDAR